MDITPKTHNEFIESAARALVAGSDLGTVAALHGMDDEQMAAALAAFESDIAKQIALSDSDGSAVRWKSQAVLGKAIHQIGDAVEAGLIPPGQLTRVIEVLHKTSGLEAALRQEPPQEKSKFSLIINLPISGEKIVIGEPVEDEPIDVEPVEVRDGE